MAGERGGTQWVLRGRLVRGREGGGRISWALCREILHEVKFFWLSTFHGQFEHWRTQLYFFQDYILHIQSPISWQGCGHSGFLPSCDISNHEPKSKKTGAKESLLDWSSYCWLIVGASYRPIDEAQKTPRLWFVTKPGRESDTIHTTHHVTMVCGGGDFQEWDHPENIKTRERERGTVNDHFRQYMELGRPQRGGGASGWGRSKNKTDLLTRRGSDDGLALGQSSYTDFLLPEVNG